MITLFVSLSESMMITRLVFFILLLFLITKIGVRLFNYVIKNMSKKTP